jgi:hypothetical protein
VSYAGLIVEQKNTRCNEFKAHITVEWGRGLKRIKAEDRRIKKKIK